MIPLPYDHFSFDLDGTIIDSILVMEKAWNQACNEFGITVPFIAYKDKIGVPFSVILEKLGLDELGEEFERRYFELTAEHIDEIKVFPGFTDFLAEVKKRGCTTSIITSKPSSNASAILEKAGISVDALVCGDEVSLGKPHQESFQHVLNAIGFKECPHSIYFGDGLPDFIFAINTGIDYCHCNFGAHGQLSPLLYPKPLTIESWHELNGRREPADPSCH